MEWVVLLAIALIYGAYKAGEIDGVHKVNKAQIDVGTWVEVIKPVKYQPTERHKRNKIPVGTQGIVTGKDKWHRINIWVAHPWAKEWDHPQLYNIKEFEKLRIKPASKVSKDVKEPTLEALGKWEGSKAEFYEIILSPKQSE